MSEQKKCLECESIIIGRSDKKFCSDMCRNSYNNRLTAYSNNIIRNINNLLKKNRRILDEACPNDKVTISKKNLLSKGFDFFHFTHQRTTQKGHTYYFVYDLGYLYLENDILLIVRDQKE